MAEDETGRNLSRSLRDGLRVSQASVGWTIAAGSGAIVVGVIGNSLVLVAFGLVGLVDGVGSGSLIVHFRHSQRQEAVSERHERRSMIVVTAGMAIIGLATSADSAYRLTAHAKSKPLALGIALAGVSVVVLTALAARKRQVARRIPSPALHADSLLSAMGAVLALIALAGTGLNAEFGWWWIDPIAAIAVACGAIGLSVALTLGPDRR